MLAKLAGFLHANRRRVVFATVLGTAIAGTFGLGVAKKMSPYGAKDPATQSVQAERRYQAASGRQINPGIVAVVSAGDVHSAAAEARVRSVERQLRSTRDVASVSSYYDSHDQAMVSFDR